MSYSNTINSVGDTRTYYKSNNLLNVRKVHLHLSAQPTNFNNVNVYKWDLANVFRYAITFDDHLRCVYSDRLKIHEIGAFYDFICGRCRDHFLNVGSMRTTNFLNCRDCLAMIINNSNNTSLFLNTRHNVIKTRGVNEYVLELMSQQMSYWNFLFMLFLPSLLIINQLTNILPNYLIANGMIYDSLQQFHTNFEFFLTVYAISILPTFLITLFYIEIAKLIHTKSILKKFKFAELPVTVAPIWSTNFTIGVSCALIFIQYLMQMLTITREENAGEVSYYIVRLILSLFFYMPVKNNRRCIALYTSPLISRATPETTYEWYLFMEETQKMLLNRHCYLHIFQYELSYLSTILIFLIAFCLFYYLFDKNRYENAEGLIKNYGLEINQSL